MEPKVQIPNFKDSGIELRLLTKARNQPDAFQMCCDLRKTILKRFREEGVEIPYPRRYIIYQQPQTSSEGRSSVGKKIGEKSR
jgi:small-conductance mechanosensitive channel